MKDLYVKVEYDLDYTGGEYHGTGQFALVPYDLVLSKLASPIFFEDADAAVAHAFNETVGADAIHIISFSLNDLVYADGECHIE